MYALQYMEREILEIVCAPALDKLLQRTQDELTSIRHS